jgi:hypothetical protein
MARLGFAALRAEWPGGRGNGHLTAAMVIRPRQWSSGDGNGHPVTAMVIR